MRAEEGLNTIRHACSLHKGVGVGTPKRREGMGLSKLFEINLGNGRKATLTHAGRPARIVVANAIQTTMCGHGMTINLPRRCVCAE